MATNNHFLVETCLLTFGLASVDNRTMETLWDYPEAKLCWMMEGEIVIGTMKEYLPVRESLSQGKISLDEIEAFQKNRKSGAFTASATMEVCRRKKIPFAVSCGIGGIGEIIGEELSPDLPALRDLGVILIATSPKDMLDIKATISWLLDSGVRVVGEKTAECNGYLFAQEPVPLSGTLSEVKLVPPLLILREMPAEQRCKEQAILTKAVSEAKAAESVGKFYHPTANATIDRETKGLSSRYQLLSLLDNARFASTLSI